ncbi:hypothetical protein CHELA40_15297 [Chelatococcus asaccharovorans]|nr:hypothetical protein CHELA17_60322 [Chelatococcus asaccharovorans]CAH1682093.1 hypothetical protein CHELA40_15297 [Chelatococcus asaccharovorans]
MRTNVITHSANWLGMTAEILSIHAFDVRNMSVALSGHFFSHPATLESE